jgi:hypothetical protein
VNAPYRAPPYLLELPPRWRVRLEGVLEPGEYVLWAGAPNVTLLEAGVLVRAALHLLAVGCGTMVFAAVTRDFWPMMFPVWSLAASLLLLVLVGASGDLRRVATTFYAQTDRRTLLLTEDEVQEVPAVPRQAKQSRSSRLARDPH